MTEGEENLEPAPRTCTYTKAFTDQQNRGHKSIGHILVTKPPRTSNP